MSSKVLIRKSHIKTEEITWIQLSYILKELHNFIKVLSHFDLVGSQMEEHTSLDNIKVVIFQNENNMNSSGSYFQYVLHKFKSLSQQTTCQNRRNYL